MKRTYSVQSSYIFLVGQLNHPKEARLFRNIIFIHVFTAGFLDECIVCMSLSFPIILVIWITDVKNVYLGIRI